MQINKDMLIGELVVMDELIPQMLMALAALLRMVHLPRWSLWKRLVWYTVSIVMTWYPR